MILSDYLACVIRAVDKAKVLPAEEIRKVVGLDVCTYDQIIGGADGQNITIEHANRIVDFFGMGVFQTTFVKETFVSGNSHYRTWESLEKDEKEIINVAAVFTSNNSKSPIAVLNYTKECSYFLDSCDNLISIIKDTGATDDNSIKSENSQQGGADTVKDSISLGDRV